MIAELLGTSNKAALTVHELELPSYRYVDVFKSVEHFVSKLDKVRKIETTHTEDLNTIIHGKQDQWQSRKITKASQTPWPTSASEAVFLPLDCFWICPSPEGEKRFVIRVRFVQYMQKVKLELACGDKSGGEAAANEIATHSVQNSIYRNRVIHLSYESGKKDEYGDVEKAETLQVLFSSIETVDEKNIILSDDQVDLIRRNILDLRLKKDVLLNNGVPTHRGVLFHGPPGTGKSFACRYICHVLKDTTCIFATGSVLTQVGALFSLARLLQPAILFIEDADLMFSSRESNMYSTTLGDLMDQMDGLRAQENISVVLTTNDIARLEGALKDRPGRISQCIYMGAPDADLRLRYIQHQLREYDLSDIDLDLLVTESEGTTQAFIKEWLHRSVQIACERLDQASQKAVLGNGDFVVALKEMQQSLDTAGHKIVGFTAPKRG
ncbi:MAG: AAA family ATPase [Anderseniella sp.]